MVAHRDIKAENVLLDTNFNIRLIDLGLSHAFSADQPTLHTACGSPAYASPEMILGRPYTQAADIWTGELPFDQPSDVQIVLRQIVRDEPQYPDILTSSLIDLLTKTPFRAIGHKDGTEHSDLAFLDELGHDIRSVVRIPNSYPKVLPNLVILTAR
jgi:serine/threonine protein kinase